MWMATDARLTGSVFHRNVMYRCLKMAYLPLSIVDILPMSRFAMRINRIVLDRRDEGQFILLEARDIKSIPEVLGRIEERRDGV